MICSYEYQLLDGTITSIKPTNPEQEYITIISISAPEGYILKNKFNQMELLSLQCTLGAENFWEAVPLG